MLEPTILVQNGQTPNGVDKSFKFDFKLGLQALC